MAEKTIFKQVIKLRGIFDLGTAYSTVPKWYKKHKFDFAEKSYKHKGEDVVIEWGGERKVTPYVKHKTNVTFQVSEAQEVDVVVGGKKAKRTKGVIVATIESKFESDIKGVWKKGPFLAKLGKVYELYFAAGPLKKLKGELAGISNELYTNLKKVLGFEAEKSG
ncbi:hypothetical protein KY326_04605, partial [Candidatus Woesearchaeota archaeon]|nr:hypothetical protein [Candidatus Woesearchaeota archaeon]